ncbi:Hpt domain-containing protein [Sulfurimonas sp.]|uniref:Hpt domain-containing protein n=1 Tax=Sulfurimonas sp. TaxID=2022749 RepID=UPI0035669380
MNKKFNFNEILTATKESFDLEEDVVFKLYRSTIELSSKVVQDIELGVKNYDYKLIENAAHKLKGASGSIRLDYIYNLCIEIENDAKANKYRNCEKDLEEIKSFFISLENAIKDPQ